MEDERGQIVGSVEGFLVNPRQRSLAALVIRWSGRSPKSVGVVALPTVVARFDETDGTLNVAIPAGATVHTVDGFASQPYPMFSDDDVVAALFAGVARD